MQTHKLAGSHAMGKGKVSVWDFSARKLNKPFPSQNKAFHTERGCSGAAVKAAAWSGAVPAVVNWNVLERVPPPPPIQLPWRQWYWVLIWNPDCFLNTVWSGCVGGNELVCWDTGHTRALECCILPVSSWAGQARGDKMVGWLQALSTSSGEGSSKPPVCLQSGEQCSSRNQLTEPLTQIRLAGKGHGRAWLGRTHWPSGLPPPSCGAHWVLRVADQSSNPEHHPRGVHPPPRTHDPAGSAGPAAGQGSGQNGARPIKASRRWQPCGLSAHVLQCFLQKLPL